MPWILEDSLFWAKFLVGCLVEKRRLFLVAGLSGASILALTLCPRSPRDRFLRAAAKELGSTNWEKYLQGVVEQTPTERPYWCGIFALWAAHKAGYACDWTWDLSTGRGFLYRLPVTTDPQPGDIAYLHAYQHHAIVEKVEGDIIHTIDGNSGAAPTRVLRNVRHRGEVAFFYDTSPMWNDRC